MFLRRLASMAVVIVAVLLSSWALGVQASGKHTSALRGTLTYFDYDSLQNPQGQKLIRAYEHSHPGVQIKIAHMPSGDPLPIIDAQLAGGTASDVTTLATDEQPWKDLSKGWYLDLTKYAHAPDPYVKGNKHWIDLLTPSAAKQIKFSNGHIYALTTTGFDVAFIYNKTIFSQLHLKVPKTWPQLLTDYKKIKAAGDIPLVWELGSHQYGGQTEQYITILEDTVMHTAISRMDTNHDGTVDIRELIRGIQKGIYSAHNADYQESWKLLKMLSPYFQLGPSSATDSSAGFNTFKTGRVATWFEGSFNSSSLATTKIKWGAFVTPRITKSITRFATNGPQRTGGFGACCGYPWTIPVTTQKRGHLKLALDFLYWLSAPKNTDAFANGSGVLSMERSANTPPDLKAFKNAASHVSRLAVAELSMPPEFIETRARLTEEYLNGTITLAQAMNQMETEMKKDAALAKKMYGFK